MGPPSSVQWRIMSFQATSLGVFVPSVRNAGTFGMWSSLVGTNAWLPIAVIAIDHGGTSPRRCTGRARREADGGRLEGLGT